MNGKLVSLGKEISKIIEYFLLVFTQENMGDMQDSDEIFRAKQVEKLTDILKTIEMVKAEINGLKNIQVTSTS